MSDNDCTQPKGHRYDADGRCQWCGAEVEDDDGFRARFKVGRLQNEALKAEITRLRARVRELEERDQPGDWRRMAL
jgi:hypothetical protein